MAEIGITLEELLREIEQLEQRVEGFTTQEMAIEFNRTPRWAREKLQYLINLGKAKCAGRKKITRIDGLTGVAPVYVLIKDEE